MLGPGIGGFELVVIALVALIVVGPKDLPLLMRRVGQMLGRARKMAAEFRASFDDMARQSELDDLRKEVEALRSGQVDALGKDVSKTFKDIDSDMRGPPASLPTATVSVASAVEPAAAPPPAETASAPKARKSRSKAAAK